MSLQRYHLVYVTTCKHQASFFIKGEKIYTIKAMIKNNFWL
jgi:hypothetical protein